jgi:hypothetical protein
MDPNANQTIMRICKRTGRQFTIIPQEKAFLDKYGLPYPELHPDEREKDRQENIYERAFYPIKDAATGETIYICINPAKHPNWKFYGKNSYRKMREQTGNLIND